MENLIYWTPSKHYELTLEADQIVQRTMTRLKGNNIDLISAWADVDNIVDLQWLVEYMLQTCNRIVILASQFEDMNLIVAKSAHIQHLYIDEIMDLLVAKYKGCYHGNSTCSHATFYQYDMIPDVIDFVVESVVIAMPKE